MARPTGPWCVIGWLAAHGAPDTLAGAAFLIGPDIVITCAHVVRDHLGLGVPVQATAPSAEVSVRFERLDSEVTGRLLRNGWFPDWTRNADGLSDIAVIRLHSKVDGVVLPAIAATMPNQAFDARVFGAEPGYERIGQEVPVRISGNANARGWRTLNPGAAGFSVERGFSGAPVMDELGNTVWGMIATVDAAGRKVSFAITADALREALRLAGARMGVRTADEIDDEQRMAMAALRDQVAGMQIEARQKRAEIARLQEMVRALGARERDTGEVGPERDALQSLAKGDNRPAAEILRERIREQRAAAAEASRQLGALLAPSDSAGALLAYREAARLEPDDVWTLFAVGDQERRAGSLPRAADSYRRAHAAARRLVEADPSNAEWQRDLSISHNKVGNIRLVQGDLPGALDAYQQSLEIRLRLTEEDPGNTEWQRDLSVSHERVGNVQLGQGDLPGALDAYQRSLEIRLRLTEEDPSNTAWQRDLSVSYERVGDACLAQGDLPGAFDAYQRSLEIRMRLTEEDPSHTEWQRDLSVNYNKVGDVRLAQGEMTGAFAAYGKSLDILMGLAAADPSNTDWQHDLAISYDKIGNIRLNEGNTRAALEAYRTSLEIIMRLAASDPSNAEWQQDLAWVRQRIAEIEG